MTQAKLSIPTAAILPFAAFSPKDVHEGTKQIPVPALKNGRGY